MSNRARRKFTKTKKRMHDWRMRIRQGRDEWRDAFNSQREHRKVSDESSMGGYVFWLIVIGFVVGFCSHAFIEMYGR